MAPSCLKISKERLEAPSVGASPGVAAAPPSSGLTLIVGGGLVVFLALLHSASALLLLPAAAVPAKQQQRCACSAFAGTSEWCRTSFRSPSRHRRGIPLSAAAPSSPSPPPPSKKGGTTGTVKFAGGRVTRPVESKKLPQTKVEEEEEDAGKSARWGVQPTAPPNLKLPDVGALRNPLDGVGSSLRKVK